MYELLIFDFDGTLVDTAPDIATHANTVLKKYHFEPRSVAKVKEAIGRGVHELLRDLGLRGDDARLEEAVLFFKKEYTRRPVIRTAPYPYVRKNLEGPLSGIKKAILTNKPQGLTCQILEQLKLGQFFEKVIGEGAGFPCKPDPSSARFVMETLGVRPKKTVLIGDSRVDHDTAKSAGIDFVHVTYGYDLLFRRKSVKSAGSAAEWPVLLNLRRKNERH